MHNRLLAAGQVSAVVSAAAGVDVVAAVAVDCTASAVAGPAPEAHASGDLGASWPDFHDKLSPSKRDSHNSHSNIAHRLTWQTKKGWQLQHRPAALKRVSLGKR